VLVWRSLTVTGGFGVGAYRALADTRWYPPPLQRATGGFRHRDADRPGVGMPAAAWWRRDGARWFDTLPCRC
jgi:hypothetical protein